jgi:DNA-binding NtrC family response regulator
MPLNMSHPLRVLVVDDELLIRWALREALEAQGYVVSEAADAAAARSAMIQGGAPPAVIILDYRLPDSNDLDLLASIKHLAPSAAVIMMTAYGTPDMIKGALDLGAYRVVSKPFEIEQMSSLVSAACASRG